MSSYEIRTYEPELHGQLLQFLGEHFPGTVKADPRYFQWKFADNPLGSSLDGYYLVLDGDTIVAQMATLKDRVEFEGQQLPFVWLVDLIVTPSHRGRGIAKRLGVEVGERHELIITNGSGDEATALWEGLKWRRVPDAALTTFTTGIHPSRAPPATRSGMRRVLSVADRPAERYWRARTKRVPGVERLDGFGPEVD